MDKRTPQSIIDDIRKLRRIFDEGGGLSENGRICYMVWKSELEDVAEFLGISHAGEYVKPCLLGVRLHAVEDVDDNT